MPTILIVDDDTDLVDAIEMVLADEGFDVVTASDERRAVELAAAHQPAMALVDYRLPRVTNVALLVRELRRVSDGIAIVLCTGSEDAAGLAVLVDADRVLRKPFAIEALLALTGVEVPGQGASPRPG